MNTPNQNFAFPVPSEILEPYIKDAVATSVLAALGSQEEIIKKLIESAIKTKVNKDGHVSRYEYENKFTLIEAVAQKELQRVTAQVIKDMAAAMRPQIEAEMRRVIGASGTVNALAKAMCDGMLPNLSATWSVKVGVDD